MELLSTLELCPEGALQESLCLNKRGRNPALKELKFFRSWKKVARPRQVFMEKWEPGNLGPGSDFIILELSGHC